MKINIIYIIDYCFKLRAVSDCIINFFFFQVRYDCQLIWILDYWQFMVSMLYWTFYSIHQL